MAENASGSAGKDGGHPSPLPTEGDMTDRVHAAMHPMEPARPNSALATAPTDTHRLELVHGHDAVLVRRQPRDRIVSSPALHLCTHVGA